jgi:hypothetical protein
MHNYYEMAYNISSEYLVELTSLYESKRIKNYMKFNCFYESKLQRYKRKLNYLE